MMKIGIPRESDKQEARVAMTPQVVSKLKMLGYQVLIESGAGAQAHFTDAAYRDVDSEIIDQSTGVWGLADIIMKICPPTSAEISKMSEGQSLIGFIWPARNQALLNELKKKGVDVFAMDCVPRISRAQKLDALSSMANIAGYRAVIEAAQHFGRFFVGQITAAGKMPPAKVLVIGAGVAGLSAIGTASSLGAIVRAFDTRPEVKEQVESMGAEFLTVNIDEQGDGVGGYAKTMSQAYIDAEMALFKEQAKQTDIIITTALIPGKPAPDLISEEILQEMTEGSVLVDLAAEQGGNCKLTEADKVVVKHGVCLVGYTNLPGMLPTQSSQLYATNLYHLLAEMTPEKEGQLTVNMEDEMIRGLTVIYKKNITWPPPSIPISSSPPQTEKRQSVDSTNAKMVVSKSPGKLGAFVGALVFILFGAGLYGLGTVAPAAFMGHFTVFVLACFIGYMVVWNVTPSLHTPLMSVTNAVSSIIVIGALTQISSAIPLIMILAFIGVLITSINITGGFMVTQRMLKMFRK